MDTTPEILIHLILKGLQDRSKNIHAGFWSLGIDFGYGFDSPYDGVLIPTDGNTCAWAKF